MLQTRAGSAPLARAWPRGAIAALALIGVIGAIYIALLATYLQPLNAFWSSDQGVKLLQIENLLRHKFGSIAIDYPGAVIDPEQRFTPLRGQFLEHNGRTFGMFSDAFAALSSPPFFVFGYPGLYLIPVGSGLLLLLVCYYLARRLIGSSLALVALALCGLATPVWFYSLTFWEHTPAALLITLALVLALRGLEGGAERELILAGMLVGVAAWLRNESVLAIPALLLALVLARGPWLLHCLLAGLGAAIGLLPLLAYNQAMFGSFLGPHVLVHLLAASAEPRAPLARLGELIAERRIWANMLLVPLDQPVLLWPTLSLALIALVSAFRRRPAGWLAWAALVSLGAAGLGLQLYRGGQFQTALIVACPLALLAFVPEPPAPAGQRATQRLTGQRSERLMLQFACCYIGLCWLAKLPDGGAQWGPRMLLPAMPLLLIVGLRRVAGWFALPDMRRLAAGLAGVAFLLANLGLLSEVAGLREIRAFNQGNHRVLTSAAQSGERVIVTDIVYAPYLLAQIFYEDRLIFRVDSGADLDALVERLDQQGIGSFYYLGIDSERLAAESTNWSQLRPAGPETRLPHNLTGVVLRLE